MPCDTIQTVGVSLTSLGRLDAKLMLTALNGLKLNARIAPDGTISFGRGETINVRTGQSQFTPARDINEIKRAYSHEVVKSQAKVNGWELKSTGPGEYEATMRF